MSQTATLILHIIKWSYDEQFSNITWMHWGYCLLHRVCRLILVCVFYIIVVIIVVDA
jgi:hypothetical protein